LPRNEGLFAQTSIGNLLWHHLEKLVASRTLAGRREENHRRYELRSVWVTALHIRISLPSLKSRRRTDTVFRH
jgi:hypothetical protein